MGRRVEKPGWILAKNNLVKINVDFGQNKRFMVFVGEGGGIYLEVFDLEFGYGQTYF